MDRLTSRRVCRCFIVLLAAVLTAGASVAQVVDVVSGVPPAPTVQGQPRDRAPARRVGTAVIRGRVVDGVTGAPVPRARVRVMNGPTSSSPVLTDAEGAFEFTKLPSGPTTLVAEKATYMPGRVPEVTATTVRARMQPLVLRDGQLLENVTISLFQGGAIAGRIVDAHGDPVENAQVRAARVVRSGRPQTMGQVQSNDLGEYRLPRLQPGRYIVQVRPQPSQGFQGAFMEGGPADVPLPQPIPTYYPGALAISQAQPLTVARGETLSGVDIMLVEGTPSLVTGTVVRGDGGPVAGGSVTSRVVGSEMSGGFDFGGGTGIRQGGVFQITLPPGEYVLEANAQMTMPMGPRATIAGRSGIWHGSDHRGRRCGRGRHDRRRTRRHSIGKGCLRGNHPGSSASGADQPAPLQS
jgi:Carboxypeptidase regulatory-like domain